jgi:hypothetical protein
MIAQSVCFIFSFHLFLEQSLLYFILFYFILLKKFSHKFMKEVFLHESSIMITNLDPRFELGFDG